MIETKPTVFIGSSAEAIEIARGMEKLLTPYADVKCWYSDFFGIGDTTIEALVNAIDCFDFAIMILTRDDQRIIRGRKIFVPRDNVIFELGLFIGALGRKRVFPVYNRDEPPEILSDLRGLTCATYSRIRRKTLLAALRPAVDRIRGVLRTDVDRHEVTFLKAFLTCIKPDIDLSDSSGVITRCYDEIRRTVEELVTKEDWSALLSVRRRLREYFELSGRYSDGARFGEFYVRALQAQGEKYESIWTKVKHVGYLRILDGQHAEGRKEIESSLSELESEESNRSGDELCFYCHRYLSISYLRDEIGGSVDSAKRCLERASSYVMRFRAGSRKHKELRARLLGNWGNIALVEGRYSAALRNYTQGHRLFQDLGDYEHIGIAKLQMAQALIASYPIKAEIAGFLGEAELIFLDLDWKEGQARVAEQYARLYERMAVHSRSPKRRRELVAFGLNSVRRGMAIANNVKLKNIVGRLEELRERLRVVV